MKWLVAAISLGLALLAGEVICRLALPRPGFTAVTGNAFPGAVQPHPSRLYQFVPNYSATLTRGTFGSMTFQTNADGLRERPLAVVRQAQVRILAVGNSFTFGTGIRQEETWPTQLERALQERSGTRSIVVINGGVSAYGLAQIRDLTEELLPRLSPQVLLLGVYAGGIDRMTDPFTVLHDFVIRRSELPVTRAVEGGLVKTQMTRPRAISIDLWLQRHTYLGAYAFETANVLRGKVKHWFAPAPAHAVAATSAANDSARALDAAFDEIRRIQQDASARGIVLLVVLAAGFDRNNRIYPDQQRVAARVAEFCKAAGIPFVDPTARLEASGVPLRVSPGDQHLSAQANTLVADYLLNALTGLRRLPPDVRRAFAGKRAHQESSLAGTPRQRSS